MGDSSLSGLVQAFQAGNREAFAELVGRYQNLATSIAFANSGDLQRSEDIAQQAFLLAWQKQSELADPDRFAGWIRGIVTNVARNERRIKENRIQKAAVELSDHHGPATNANPQNQASREEQNELLWSSLNQIPLEYREPLVLFYREDLSVAAVAEQLELSKDVVKQRLSRGRKMLKQEIETIVEDFLVDSKPARNFSAGVIAALPSVSATAKAAALKTATVKVGQAAAGKALVGKAIVGTLGTGALLGLAGGILGSLGGLFGAWLGIKNGIKQATSEEEVIELKSLFRLQALLMLALLLGIFATVYLPTRWQSLGLVAVQLTFVGALMMLIMRFVRRQRELHQIHGLPAVMDIDASKHSLSQQENQSSFWGRAGGIAGAVIGSFAWLVIVTIRSQAWAMLSFTLLAGALLLLRYIVLPSRLQTKPSKVIQQTQCLIRDICVVQCLILVLMWAIGGFAKTNGTVEGYPVWVMLAFIGVLCTGLYFGLGYAAETSRRSEERDLQDHPNVK